MGLYPTTCLGSKQPIYIVQHVSPCFSVIFDKLIQICRSTYVLATSFQIIAGMTHIVQMLRMQTSETAPSDRLSVQVSN